MTVGIDVNTMLLNNLLRKKEKGKKNSDYQADPSGRSASDSVLCISS